MKVVDDFDLQALGSHLPPFARDPFSRDYGVNVVRMAVTADHTARARDFSLLCTWDAINVSSWSRHVIRDLAEHDDADVRPPHKFNTLLIVDQFCYRQSAELCASEACHTTFARSFRTLSPDVDIHFVGSYKTSDEPLSHSVCLSTLVTLQHSIVIGNNRCTA